MTNWCYLLVFNEAFDAGRIRDFIDEQSDISYWVKALPNSLFLVSTLSAGQISTRIENKFGTAQGLRFFVTEVHSDRQGRLPASVWYMLKHPDSPRKPKE